MKIKTVRMIPVGKGIVFWYTACMVLAGMVLHDAILRRNSCKDDGYFSNKEMT